MGQVITILTKAQSAVGSSSADTPPPPQRTSPNRPRPSFQARRPFGAKPGEMSRRTHIQGGKASVRIAQAPTADTDDSDGDFAQHHVALYMQQKIEMILVEDSDMMADCDTKIVDRDKFFKCIKFQMNL